MAIAFDAVIEPDDLTTYVRGIPADSTLAFLRDFPRIDSETNSVDWGEIVRTNRAAKFRSFDGRIHVSRRDTAGRSAVKLPPLSTSLSLGELERLQLEFVRNGGTNDAVLAEAAYNDADQLTREVQNRLEQAWGNVLTDGVLSLPEIGGEADFGVPAGQKNIAAANSWGNPATGTPLMDLQVWSDVYTANNGKPPARIRTSLKKRREMLRSKEVIDAIHGSTAGHTRITLTQLDELLRGEGLPTLDEPYDTSLMVADASGNEVETRVLHPDRVLLLPQDLSELGGTAWGVSATALELVNSRNVDLTFEEAAGIVGVVLRDGPPFREMVFVDAVAMPILRNARRLFTALA